MAYTYKPKTSNKFGGFLDFLIQYWYILLGLIIAIPMLLRYFKYTVPNDEKEAAVKSEVKQIQIAVDKNIAIAKTQDADVQKVLTDQILKNYAAAGKKKLLAAAQQIASDLGITQEIEGSWYEFALSPASWSENDAKVGATLRACWNDLTALSQLYQKVFTQNHNLKADILRLLDADELEKCRKWFKSKNVTFI